MKRLIVIALFLAACTAPPAQAPARDPAADYVTEYGGVESVYREIAIQSCSQAQDSFDQAAENNDAAEPGTNAHRASLGYMLPAEARMKVLNC